MSLLNSTYMCLILKSNIRSNLWDYGEINESIAEHFMKIVRTLDTYS